MPLWEAIFIFSAQIGLKSAKNRVFCILFTPVVGGFEPPASPPGYAIEHMFSFTRKNRTVPTNYLLLDLMASTFSLLLAPTMVVTTEVEVEELCTNTVTRIPMMRPTTALVKIEVSPKMYPVVFPAEKKRDETKRLDRLCDFVFVILFLG